MSVNLKNWVPAWVKQSAKNMLLRQRLRNALKAVSKLPEGEIPNREQLSELIAGWSNVSFSANLGYLEAVAKTAVTTRGAILECGTGVTTILLGVLCGRRNIEVWTLEHSEEWKDRVSETLESNGISGVHVCLAPLVEYGDFVWYDPPLAQMPKEFSLVICDGPPGTTKGGRYGLMPVIGSRLKAGSIILLDDAERPGEIALIKRWEDETRFETEIITSEGRGFAIMRRLN